MNKDRNYKVFYKTDGVESNLLFTSSVQLNDDTQIEFYSEEQEMLLFRTAYTVIATVNQDRNEVKIVTIGKIVMLK